MPDDHEAVPSPNLPRGASDDVPGVDRSSLDDLFGLVYEELRALARRQRRRWQGDDTLNTTALVHEAYVKLVAQKRLAVASRGHFLALASRAMRHILCNHARAAGARKRGGDLERVSLKPSHARADADAQLDDHADVLVALDDALRRLEHIDERRSRVVECRFFGGLTVEETASALGTSPRTVKRDWQVAQAWLQREIAGPA
jgi:RNA polymerase sigma factor (TIGR02999 family)